MKLSAKSDKGQVRENNEDMYEIGTFDDGTAYAVVCDGMGGHKGGEVASKLATESIVKEIKELYRANMTYSNIKNMISSAVSAANIKIYDESKKNTGLAGMGTTVCIVICIDNCAYIAHAGDSRVYLINNNNIKQITVDHSLVQELLNAGIINKEEAEVHPQKNIITRALGLDEEVDFDFTQIDINDNDKILLCTDGLTNMIDDNAIIECLNDENIHNYAQNLVKKANDAGGKDNITAVVMVK